MGQVFSARDLELGRTVAIKILRSEIAQNARLLQRFRREAKILASLNHPHIAQIYGIAEGAATQAGENPPRGLVLELVEGASLEDRILKQRFGWREALEIAAQIADGLATAHAQGVVHRDLKPANIKITSSGSVKILDFGIALGAAERDSTGDTELATVAGTIIGTPGYMSPEQVRGQSVDKQTDVWAFGCVLYEMLTRQPAFGGVTDVDMLGVILQRDPDWSQLPRELPAEVSRLLRRCLRKDRSERLCDMGDIGVWIQEALAAPMSTGGVEHARRRSLAPWLVAGAAALGFAVLAVFGWRQPSLPVARLQLVTSGASALSLGYNDRDIGITPDGSKLIWIGNTGSQIFVRRLDALTPEAVFTGAPFGVFTSPDGQWIGTRDRGSILKKVPLNGGPAITLATIDDVSYPAGATWAPNGTIILASTDPSTGLQRVSDTGDGRVELLTTPDRAQGEADHLWPEMLPDGHSVLFTITALTGGLEAARIAVFDLEAKQRREILGGSVPRGASDAHYVPSGHLVYALAGTLQAVAFDADKLELRGTPVTVIPDVVTMSPGGTNFVVANNGTMAYLSASTPRALVWVDREGRETPVGAPSRPYFLPALSPDGTKVAVYSNDQDSDIWIWDFDRQTFSRLTTVPGRDVLQVWTPDSKSVIFASERSGVFNLYRQDADRPGEAAERLSESSGSPYPMDVTRDGQLIFAELTRDTLYDLMTMDLDGAHQVAPLVQDRYMERNGTVSPDGRWLAYEADLADDIQIFVRPYPDVTGSPIQVTTEGGRMPIWTQRQNGPLELIYVAPATGALMGVEVRSGPRWEATRPSVVVRPGYFTLSTWWGRSYDVAPDGERFLMIKEGGPLGEVATTNFVVVQNWFQELRRLAP
jgi:eukaryotic-like serine/threonine-protein kinase